MSNVFEKPKVEAPPPPPDLSAVEKQGSDRAKKDALRRRSRGLRGERGTILGAGFASGGGSKTILGA